VSADANGGLDRAAARFRTAPAAAGRTPWRAAEWLAIDLELTGLNPRKHEIVAIGAVPIRGGRVVVGDAFYTLVRPSHPSELSAVLVHKLRTEDLADAPPIEEALTPLLERMAGTIPVCHTARVEAAFLGRELRRLWLRMPRAADTEVLGRVWLRQRGVDAGGIPLSGLAHRLGLRATTPHHALGDALTTATAFIALATHLEQMGPQTVATLVRAGDQFVSARRFGPG
jgi:DNA polymerase-3 subunit epsilon